MTEMLKSLTRLANAAAEYLERQNHPLLPLAMPAGEAVAAEAPKTRKPRTPKVDAPAVPVVPETPAVAPEVMTEEQSMVAVRSAADALMTRFQNVKDGKPEGFHMARALLAEDFKVGKMADLVHAQRLQFIAKVKALLSKADAQPTGTEL